jgi:hypothetical protein
MWCTASHRNLVRLEGEVSISEDTPYTKYEIQTLWEHTHIKKGPSVQKGNTTAWSQSNRWQWRFNNCSAPGGQKMSLQWIQPGLRILVEQSTVLYRTCSQRWQNRNCVCLT